MPASVNTLGRLTTLVFLTLALLSAVAAYRMATEKGITSIQHAADSRAGMLVDMTASFVSSYSDQVARHAPGQMPGPFIFRAEALDRFARSTDERRNISTSIVGLPGRAIAREPAPGVMTQQLRTLESTPGLTMISGIDSMDSGQNHRSIWAFFATDQACADCHNRMQGLSGEARWQVGDLMGAQVVDQSVDRQLNELEQHALQLGLLVFMSALVISGMIAYLLKHLQWTRELKALAMTDSMTGCINRRALALRFASMTGRTSGALLMMDIDRFKQINDCHGHDVGDRVIRFPPPMSSNISVPMVVSSSCHSDSSRPPPTTMHWSTAWTWARACAAPPS